MAVDRPEVAVLVGPLVPYPYPVFLQVAHVGVALEKPQQFVDNRLEMQFLGGEQRESLFEIESHLMAEHGERARARAVALRGALVEYASEQVEILFHCRFMVSCLR